MHNWEIKSIEVQEGLTRQQVDSELNSLLGNPVVQEVGKVAASMVLAKALEKTVPLFHEGLRKVKRILAKKGVYPEVAVTVDNLDELNETDMELMSLYAWKEDELSPDLLELLQIVKDHNVPYYVGYLAFTLKKNESEFSIVKRNDRADKYGVIITKDNVNFDITREFTGLKYLKPYLHGYVDTYAIK